MQPRLDVIGLTVSDMARSLAFYRRLGLDIPPDADAAPHVEVPLPGGLRLAWDTVDVIRSVDSEWKPPSGANRIDLAFRVDGPADVDRAYAELLQLGYSGHNPPWDAFWGQRYATVLDPDSNTVHLFAPLDAGAAGA
jgi:catechol 2,3-dioxygenase-like lactoylglutathione lyase family enzyme